jgi:hypothetical protein
MWMLLISLRSSSDSRSGCGGGGGAIICSLQPPVTSRGGAFRWPVYSQSFLFDAEIRFLTFGHFSGGPNSRLSELQQHYQFCVFFARSIIVCGLLEQLHAAAEALRVV